MGLTRKKHYDSYSLAFKVKAVKESKTRGVKAIDVADALGIYPVMLHRWRQEFKERQQTMPMSNHFSRRSKMSLCIIGESKR